MGGGTAEPSETPEQVGVGEGVGGGAVEVGKGGGGGVDGVNKVPDGGGANVYWALLLTVKQDTVKTES